MYQLYKKTDSEFNPKKLIGEYGELAKAKEKVKMMLAKDPEVKYVIEETTGHFNSYGDLLTDVIEEN